MNVFIPCATHELDAEPSTGLPARQNATSALGVITDQLAKAEEADFSTLMALTDEPDMTGTRGPDRTHRLGDGGK
ncbi:hypothetical protein AB0M12_13065 [Nocardia vinacea]|uniref:hypothetical protein n=1 Tax=Nocardia vinacea TaxID=96468 RepID=UPI0034256AE8